MSAKTTAESDGWHIEIVAENGSVHIPDTLDTPERVPATNDYPEIEIPVRRNDKWLDPQFEKAEMRVWCNGKRQPIDQLEEIEVGEAQTTLRGRGAIELKTPVEVEYDQKPIHEAAKELIEENTSYTANVDAPNVDVEDNVQVADLTTTEDFLNEFEIRETDPIDTSNGSLSPHQTCIPYDAVDDNNIAPNTTAYNQSWFSGGAALGLETSNALVVFSAIRFDYRVPAEHVGIKIRDRTLASSDIRYHWNGQEFERNTSSTNELNWRDIGGNSAYSDSRGYQAEVGRDIEPNTNYWFKVTAEATSDYRLDAVAIYDTRYSYNWPNYNGNDGSHLYAPQLYPKRLWITSRELPQTRTVVGGMIDPEFNSTNSLGVDDDVETPNAGFSPTQGRYYLVNELSDPGAPAEWNNIDDPGGSLKAGFSLGRWGSDATRGSIPTSGFRRHAVQNYQLYADLSTLPIVINQSYNKSLRDILSDLAERGDFIWEYRRDTKTGEPSIEWTKIGQREVDVSVDEVEYTVSKNNSQIVEQTAVYGASQNYIARIRANTGAAVGLPHSRLQDLSEVVRNPRSGEEYERNEDYSINYKDGEITVLSDGRMTGGRFYEVEYEYQTYAEYSLPGVSDPVELPPQDIAGLASNTACAQAARTLIQELQTPQFEAEITIPEETIRWSLADSLNVEGLETNGQALKHRNVAHRPGETTLTLGIGRDVSEIIRDIETRVSSVSRNS